MAYYGIPLVKRVPCLRPLLSLAAGIILQWHLDLNIQLLWVIQAFSICLLCLYPFIPFFHRYRFRLLHGLITCFLFISTGAMLTRYHDARKDPHGLLSRYSQGQIIAATLEESPVEKSKSFKTVASVSYLYNDYSRTPANGRIIIYFRKDTMLPTLAYGQAILFKKKIQPVSNSGNPGAFDYKRYSLFQGITHQVFLEADSFQIIGHRPRPLTQFIIITREWILRILREHISGSEELGLAEALLIGYKDDLDRTLVQSYSNTGVVHIIAISGLHLGLVYAMLLLLLKPLRHIQKLKWIRLLIILAGLWMFTLLAGAQPSVLRSSIMFTCLAAGECLARRASIFNSLAFSAFLLLCINPFWLWDIGFQLSFSAVAGIIIFMRPIYDLFYFRNKLADMAWKMNAVTLSAQTLTTPICIYHFHQFPNYFLLTNMVAVPLSSLVLVCEVILCTVYWMPTAASLLGQAITFLLGWMNWFVQLVESWPFSVWKGLQLEMAQVVLLFLSISAASHWLMHRSAMGLKICLACLLGFLVIRTQSIIQTNSNRMLIIYNVPKKRAMDFIYGRRFYFHGDSSLVTDQLAAQFYLDPSRIKNRVSASKHLPGLHQADPFFTFNGSTVMILENKTSLVHPRKRPVIDLLVVSYKPGIELAPLAENLIIKQVVLDPTVPVWKSKLWNKACDSIGIPCHDVATKGAFVMTMQ